MDIPSPKDLLNTYLQSANVGKIIKHVVDQVKLANEKGQTQTYVEHGDRRILEAVAKAFEDKGYVADIKPGQDMGDLLILTLNWEATARPSRMLPLYENEHEK